MVKIGEGVKLATSSDEVSLRDMLAMIDPRFTDSMFEGERVVQNVFISGGGVTVTSHYDRGFHAIFLMVHGAKRWIMSPPKDIPKYSLYPLNHWKKRTMVIIKVRGGHGTSWHEMSCCYEMSCCNMPPYGMRCYIATWHLMT